MHDTAEHPRHTGPLAFWFNRPLFIRIAIGLVSGLVLGFILHPHWHQDATTPWLSHLIHGMVQTSDLIMRMLNAVAPPLILLAVIRSLIATHIKGAAAGKLIYLLLLNVTVAILVGLVIANTLTPGKHVPPLKDPTAKRIDKDPVQELLNGIPDSLVKPLVDNNSIGVIVLAISFGLAARHLKPESKEFALHLFGVAFELVVKVLYWVLELVPLAVFCRVGSLLTTEGVDPFKSLAWFVLAVIGALLIQSVYYLLRIWWRSWVTPWQLLKGARDALVMAFSTGSSTATMPLTYECLTRRVGLREDSTSLGVLVGGNFNHDGTALYEAMSALFVAQAMGIQLTLVKQLVIVVTSMIAAVGAAGIPEAGLVTMTLVFNAVGLPPGQVKMVLPVDWFLDRCRTAINVLGDTSVACLLDGKKNSAKVKPSEQQELSTVLV